MRNAIAFVAGPEDRATGANVTASVSVGELRIGRTELIVTLLGIATIAARGARASLHAARKAGPCALRQPPARRRRRASTPTGSCSITWAASAGLAGLAGIFYALPAGSVNPNLGFTLILSIFAAVVVGGIGNAYGALAGGLLIGLVQEWSTLVIDPSLKVAVGFGALILVLLVRPQGLFGRGRPVDR